MQRPITEALKKLTGYHFELPYERIINMQYLDDQLRHLYNGGCISQKTFLRCRTILDAAQANPEIWLMDEYEIIDAEWEDVSSLSMEVA